MDMKFARLKSKGFSKRLTIAATNTGIRNAQKQRRATGLPLWKKRI